MVARTAPRAYASLSAAGRAVLRALSWCRRADGGESSPVDLCALCEQAPLPPQRRGASLLSTFRYEAGGAAAPHVDRSLLTLVACTDGGLELRGKADSWVQLQLQRGEAAVLVGATLTAVVSLQLRAAMHRVVPQATSRVSAALRLRGVPEALLPRVSVGAVEKAFDQAHIPVNRNCVGADGTRASGAEPKARVGENRRRAPRRPCKQAPPQRAAAGARASGSRHPDVDHQNQRPGALELGTHAACVMFCSV